MTMNVRSVVVTLHAPAMQSLKDKRQILRSLLDRVRRKFNVSIAEVAAHDLHQKIVVGIACVGGTCSIARQIVDQAVRFIEDNCPVDVILVEDY
jgi:uncharacterized protein